MHILITGSSGFVGQHLLHELITSPRSDEIQYDITALHSGRLAGFHDAVSEMAERHDSVSVVTKILDISNEEEVEAWYTESSDKFDICLHLAAMSSPRACQADPEKAQRVNCPTALFKCLSKDGVPLVALSTDQVYDGTPPSGAGSTDGETPHLPDLSFIKDDNVRETVSKAYKNHPDSLYAPIHHTEDEKPMPANIYGRTKVLMEEYISAHYSGPSMALRSSLILGPTVPILSDGVHDTFFQFIESRQEPTTFFINEFRNVVAVSHVLKVLRWCVETTDKLPTEGIYNMGGPHRIDRFGLAVRVMSTVQNAVPAIQTSSLSPLDISMDTTKLEKLTGIAPGPSDWDELFSECSRQTS